MRLEPILNLAMAMQATPGVYAFLLGSGVSRSAGVPTGWEIVLDLLRKVACQMNEDPEPEPEKWYRAKFGEDPDYAKLLETLAGTGAERAALLRSYFEPSREEREQGTKIPTAAHQAIAALAKLGHIRMILTTNFDRLVEIALEAEGVTADVISTEDDLKGAMPYAHSECTVIKLHGDYRDARIKNTPSELAEYPEALNLLLDRILDEFGLVVCGWSAQYDTALRSAILRCPSRRFTTFWLARGPLTQEAEKIIQQRAARVIDIEGADEFFAELQEKTESLGELERLHPISTAIAVATLKRYMSEPRHSIRLQDLVEREAKGVLEKLRSERFTGDVRKETRQEYQRRVREYAATAERLMAMASALAYYQTGEHARLITKCLERVLSVPRPDVESILTPLLLYPALLVAYSGGIPAVASGHFRNLATILLEPKHRGERGAMRPAVEAMHVRHIFQLRDGAWVPRPGAENERAAASNYLFDLLWPVLEDYLSGHAEYEDAFDTFEYLLALTRMDLVQDDWAPAGRLVGRCAHAALGWDRRTWERSGPAEFLRLALAEGERSELLKAGFFKGSLDRLKDIVARHDAWRDQQLLPSWRPP